MSIASCSCKERIWEKGIRRLLSKWPIHPLSLLPAEQAGRPPSWLQPWTWKEDRRFVVSRVLKDEKDRKQLSFLEGDAYDCFFFHRWYGSWTPAAPIILSNEAIFLLMMLAYNLFLLFKMDFSKGTEYQQQIKTFRLKYIKKSFRMPELVKVDHQKLCTMEEIMLNRR